MVDKAQPTSRVPDLRHFSRRALAIGLLVVAAIAAWAFVCIRYAHVGEAARDSEWRVFAKWVVLAMSLMRVLHVVLGVALLAFILRSRLIFLAGTIGRLLGLLIPEPPQGCTLYSNAEAASMGAMCSRADHALNCALLGAMLGISL
jgi:hypothetical protein